MREMRFLKVKCLYQKLFWGAKPLQGLEKNKTIKNLNIGFLYIRKKIFWPDYIVHYS